MNNDFKVVSPISDDSIINIQQQNFDQKYNGLVNKLPMAEMQRQQNLAIRNKRGVMKSTINQSVNSLIADQVRHIFDNRNHPM